MIHRVTDLIPVVLLALACFVGGYVLLSRLLRGLSSQQPRLRKEPIPPAWYDIVDRRVPLARDLTIDERERLLRLAQRFVAEKHFEGCGGVTVTEEMKVTIAAVACLLLLHLEGPCYPTLRTVLIYPHAFVPKRTAGASRTGELMRPAIPVVGQSWGLGVVIVAWDEVVRGARDATDGHNVVLHEFAHQLDGEDGVGDGVPLLATGALRTWARVLGQEYERLRDDSAAQRLSALDPYGATSKTEFFAVATESFFERPLQLEREHPELYAELKRFYGQDPARRVSPTTA